MVTRIKLEHYVPQFYLKNFSIKNEGKALYCFDKCTSSRFIADIHNIASEKYFARCKATMMNHNVKEMLRYKQRLYSDINARQKKSECS